MLILGVQQLLLALNLLDFGLSLSGSETLLDLISGLLVRRFDPNAFGLRIGDVGIEPGGVFEISAKQDPHGDDNDEAEENPFGGGGDWILHLSVHGFSLSPQERNWHRITIALYAFLTKMQFQVSKF